MEVIISNHSGVAVNLDLLHELAKEALASEKVEPEAELSIVLVAPGEIQKLNVQYRGVDSTTDVLSFPQSQDDPTGPLLLGDVVISPQIAQVQAAEFDHSLEKEMAILLIHGILHLLGFDHEIPDERIKMEGKEKEILEDFCTEKKNQ